MRHREQISNETPPYMSAVIERVPELIADLKARLSHVDYVFDLNTVTAHSHESLFTNYWIHVNARGNELCADYVMNILRDKGILGGL